MAVDQPQGRRVEAGAASVGMLVEPAAPHQIGAGQTIALQQFEDAAEQFAAMERRGDEFVAVAVVPARAGRYRAGEQRLDPRLSRPQPAHRRGAVERARQFDRGDDQRETLGLSDACRGEAARYRGDRETFLGEDALDRLPTGGVVIDNQNHKRLSV